MAPSCPKERAQLSPLCAGDSDIDRLGDGKNVVEFDATCIPPVSMKAQGLGILVDLEARGRSGDDLAEDAGGVAGHR
jgi:hypothetical protein